MAKATARRTAPRRTQAPKPAAALPSAPGTPGGRSSTADVIVLGTNDIGKSLYDRLSEMGIGSQGRHRPTIIIRDMDLAALAELVAGPGRVVPLRDRGEVNIAMRGQLHEKIEQAADAWASPDLDTGSELVKQAELRRGRIEAFEKRYGLLSASEVADLSGSESTNRSATATRWLAQKKIFAVSLKSQQRFPGFQFDDDGQPRDVVATLMQALPFDPPGWDLAFWLDTPHAMLPGHAKPAALLARSPARVVEAARHTASEIAEPWL